MNINISAESMTDETTKEFDEIKNLAYYISSRVTFVRTYNAAAIALASRSFTDWISYQCNETNPLR